MEVSTEEDIETRQLFEEGTSECMRDVGLHLGKALFSASLVSALREVKTFPIRNGTDPEDLIRFCFRKLVEAIPVIDDVSIWRVLIAPEGQDIASSVPSCERDSLVAAGFFNTEQVASILSTPDEKSVYQAHYSSLLKGSDSKNERDDEKTEAGNSKENVDELSSAKEVYSNIAPWSVGIPVMLTHENEVDLETSKFGTVGDADDEEASRGSDTGSDESSGSDSAESSSSSGEAGSAAALTKSKSLFGGLFTSLKKRQEAPVKVSTNAPTNFLPARDDVSVPDNVVRVHSEINRCMNTLTQSSFYVSACGGAYLSSIPQRPENSATEQVLQHMFKSSNSFLDERNPCTDTRRKNLPKKIIPGTRGVSTSERLVHISESKTSPPNLQNAPLPKGKIFSPAETKAKAMDKRINKAGFSKPTPEKRERNNSLRYEYFVAVRACGLGGNDGWGIIGEEGSRAVDSMVESMVDILGKALSSSSNKSSTK
jgi:hypothetical protein